MANIVTKTYDLNITPGGVRTLVNLSQYENGRQLVFRLVGDANISIPSGSTAVIEGTKPDGNVYSGTGTVDIAAGTVTFQEEVQMTAVAGEYMAKVKVLSGSQMVASGIITMLISMDPVPDGAVESDSDVQGLIAEARQVYEGIQNDLNSLDTEVDVLSARMDTFAQLPSGSTSGDAELMDIRVGANGTTYPTAGDAVRGQVSDLFTALDEVLDFTGEDVKYFNAFASGDSYLPATIRAFYDVQIPKHTILREIIVPIGSVGANGTITIDVWELDDNGDTLTKVFSKTVAPASNTMCVVMVDKYSKKYRYVSILCGNVQVYYRTNQTGNKFYASYDVSQETETLSLSGLSPFNNMVLKGGFDYYINSQSENTIHIGENYPYEEIQDALDNVDDSASNPYTFIIHPKSTPYKRFSMIRKTNEKYPWTNAPIRYISLIGVDKYHCIVEDNNGNYRTPPAEILTNGLIKNITFIASHANQDSTATQGAYAVHIDAEPVGNIGYEMDFENCTFESDQTAGVGIGLHNACHLKFKNCEFISTASESYVPYEGYTNLSYLGAFYCHSSTKSTDTDQILTIENCVAISNENRAYTFATNADCYMTLKAYNNTFWCEGTSQANGYKGSYCNIYGASHGNNQPSLNAS